jgi:type II secretory pathway pseudopilin PulG
MKSPDINGLEGLPLKLLIVFLLISISTPVVLESLQNHERTVIITGLRTEAEKIRSAVISAYIAGPGNVRSVDVTLPISSRNEQGRIEVGGNIESIDSFSIRYWLGDNLIGTLFVNEPPVRMTSEDGNATTVIGIGAHLRISCVDGDGDLRILIGEDVS